MKILFIHQNFPGQFKHLAPSLREAGHEVHALTLRDIKKRYWKGIEITRYKLDRSNGTGTHPWVTEFESKVIRGEACMLAAIKMREDGFYPDVVVAHPGWGESLFIKEVWPETSLKIYCEYYYHASGFDVGFDLEFGKLSERDASRIFTKNANMLLNLEIADAAISPTSWQVSTFPAHLRKSIAVIHDGIDTDFLQSRPHTKVTLPDGTTLAQEDEVVTYVSRTLEPYRGFHVFLRSLAVILRKRPKAIILVVGSDQGGYGAAPPEGETWKSIFWEEISPGLTDDEVKRVVFLGALPYEQYLAVLGVSSAHVYLTYPFVLSWSLLEAMSMQCTIIASNTGPVREVIEHGETGVLVDFFDSEGIANAVIDVLSNKIGISELGKRARMKVVDQYDLSKVCLPRQIEWVETC